MSMTKNKASSYLAWAALAALLLAAGGPAWALTADQVVSLKHAGVNEDTIRTLLDIEMVVSSRGLTGRYVFGAASDGRDTIVYQAHGPLGEERYPLRLDPENKDRLAAILRAVSVDDDDGGGAVPNAKSYTLLLASFRNQTSAAKRAQLLAEKGLAVRVEEADLGERGKSYRLLWGKFADQAAAESQGKTLRGRGLVASYALTPD